jgi:hypothetical protein
MALLGLDQVPEKVHLCEAAAELANLGHERFRFGAGIAVQKSPGNTQGRARHRDVFDFRFW